MLFSALDVMVILLLLSCQSLFSENVEHNVKVSLAGEPKSNVSVFQQTLQLGYLRFWAYTLSGTFLGIREHSVLGMDLFPSSGVGQRYLLCGVH